MQNKQNIAARCKDFAAKLTKTYWICNDNRVLPSIFHWKGQQIKQCTKSGKGVHDDC